MSDPVKIFVVEDNDFVRMQIVQFLGSDTYDVHEFSNAKDALVKTDKTVDLAIVDVRMEPIDGFEFIKSLRAKELDTAAILVTGDDNPDLLNEANKWGIGAVLMKPVQKDRLLKTVERVLTIRARSHA